MTRPYGLLCVSLEGRASPGVGVVGRTLVFIEALCREERQVTGVIAVGRPTAFSRTDTRHWSLSSSRLRWFSWQGFIRKSG